MFTYVHLRYRSYFFGAIIELYAKEGKCMHMNICVTVAQNFW
jgi:hypothetical protein